MADQTTYDYVTDNKIGIDLTATYASTSAGSTSLFPATPGTRVNASNNGVYMFARAASTVNQFDAVVFSTYENSASTTPPVLAAVPVTTTNAGALGYPPIGFAQSSVASAYYGWFALNGSVRVNVAAGTQPKVLLYTTSTAGVLSGTTVSAGLVVGLTANTSAASASAPYCMANNVTVQLQSNG